MQWVGISGSWRNSCEQLEIDLAREVLGILKRGDGIVTGGALGVDYRATQLALEHQPDGRQLKVMLPTSLDIFRQHYVKRVHEGVITYEQAQRLISQLEQVQRLGSLTEIEGYTILNEESYYARNTEVVNQSDSLLAFQVNRSQGTQDTIDKARAKGIAITCFSYTV